MGFAAVSMSAAAECVVNVDREPHSGDECDPTFQTDCITSDAELWLAKFGESMFARGNEGPADRAVCDQKEIGRPETRPARQSGPSTVRSFHHRQRELQ